MDILIGLGGNLGSVRENFFQALALLNDWDFCEVLQISSLYRSAPIGPDQPDYLNAAALLRISVDPRKLLVKCLRIEEKSGRDRVQEGRWGPRTLDLDLLLAPNIICAGPHLNLPHPRLHERAFALRPSAEIAGDWIHAFQDLSLRSLADREEIATQDIRRLKDETWKQFLAEIGV